MWVGGRWWNRALLVLAVPLLVALLAFVAWWADSLGADGNVVRNTEIDGVAVGGMSDTDLVSAVEDLSSDLSVVTVRVDLGDDVLEASADKLGISVDIESTVLAAMAAGRDGSVVTRAVGWIGAFRNPNEVSARFSIDQSIARRTIEADGRMADRMPVEPTIEFDGERLAVVAAVPGRTLDVDDIVERLAVAVADGLPDQISSQWAPVQTIQSTDLATRMLAEVDRRTDAGVVVEVRGTQRWIPPKVLFGWIGSEVSSGELTLTFEDAALLEYVEGLFDDFSVGTISTAFNVVDGVPVLGDIGDDRAVCCSTLAVDAVQRVVRGESFGVATLPLRSPTIDESIFAASQLGIVELVGSFTTNYVCCQSRVTNIQRIADIIRGVVLEPGEQLSINGFVGRRTTENGFVGGGVIDRGRFNNAVGGGISQFATTMFNAAFFAGLDIPEYQSHSIYISRYPYGREATLSFPAPDLVIDNTSEYAVLIWPTYTDTSLTVDIYSTKYIEVEALDYRVGSARRCTRVTSPRQRTYPDGTVVIDEFFATYRPGTGLDCNGNPT